MTDSRPVRECLGRYCVERFLADTLFLCVTSTPQTLIVAHSFYVYPIKFWFSLCWQPQVHEELLTQIATSASQPSQGSERLNAFRNLVLVPTSIKGVENGSIAEWTVNGGGCVLLGV